MSRATLVLAALFAAFIPPSPAEARPVVAGAVPLSILGLPTPAGLPDAALCPSAAGFEGTGNAAGLRAALHKGERALPSWMFGILVSKHAVLVCDPDAARAQRFIPALTGEVAAANRDWAWFGLRGLQLNPTDGLPAGLRVGDRVELPAGGPKTAVDLAVAAGAGVRATRVPPGAPPVRIEISGTASAPLATVTRADGSVWRWDVAPIQAVPLKAKVRSLRRDHVTVRGTTTPGALVHLSTKRSRTVVAGADGRFTAELKLPRKPSTLVIATIDRPSRTQKVLGCTVRWDAARRAHRARACRATVQHDRVGSAAARASAATPSASRPSLTRRAARDPRAVPATATAKPALADTEVTHAFTLEGPDATADPAGDLNGDGRPDFVVIGFGEGSATILRVSTGTSWATVAVKRAGGTVFETYPDLTGDGRDELLADGGAIVTDAFTAPTLPKEIDLSERRRPSSADLVPPKLDPSTDPFDVDFSWLAWISPIGTVPDATGDGRPEIVLGDGTPMVIASDDLRPGVQMNAATVTPVTTLGDLKLPDAFAPSEGPQLVMADEQIEWEEAREFPSTVAIGGKFTMLTPVDRARSPKEAQPVEIYEVDARGGRSAVRRFNTDGVPQLLDVDPATGDALVRLLAPKPCRVSLSVRRTHAGCPERILRVDGSGQIETTISLRRGSSAPIAAFAPDGSDADQRLEVAVSTGGLSTDLPRLVRSTQPGAAKFDRLPVFAAAGKPIDTIVDFTSMVLPNGSRWLMSIESQWFGKFEEPPPPRVLLVRPR